MATSSPRLNLGPTPSRPSCLFVIPEWVFFPLKTISLWAEIHVYVTIVFAVGVIEPRGTVVCPLRASYPLVNI